MLLTEARREARVRRRAAGPARRAGPRRLGPALIAEGHGLVRECLAVNRPGRYQILAAINAVHTSRPDRRRHRLVAGRRAVRPAARLDPSPIVALNRAVAVAELDGPAVGLAEVDRLDLTTATTPGTPPAPTCSAGSAAPPRPGPRTTPPSPSPTTPPSAPTSPAAATSCEGGRGYPVDRCILDVAGPLQRRQPTGVTGQPVNFRRTP